MPEWLKRKENYVSANDSDAFIDKSIRSLINVLSKFRMHERRKAGIQMNALIKLLTIIVLLIFDSLSQNFLYVFMNFVIVVVVLNFLDIKDAKSIIKISSAAAAFTFIIMLPSLFLGYGNNSLIVCIKVWISAAFVNILAYTTPWNELINALKLIHIPDMFILVLDITIKYIIILGEFSLSMLYALKLRSVGKSDNKAASLSGIVGTLFLKSREMADEMYTAMECRGFTGEYKIYNKFRLKLPDYVLMLLGFAMIYAYFFLI